MADGIRILVINPNSTASMTQDIRASVFEAYPHHRSTIDFLTMADGPPAIQTAEDVERAAAAVVERIAIDRADAYVVACYSDPGVTDAFSVTDRPVVGIGAASMSTAANGGRRFGIIATMPEAAARHERRVAVNGHSEQLAGVEPLNLGVLELGDASRTLERAGMAATRLKVQGAEAIILGCAGLAPYRKQLESILGLTVIEPSQAAVATALARLGPPSSTQSHASQVKPT